MHKFKLPYGNRQVFVQFNHGVFKGEFIPNRYLSNKSEEVIIESALDKPISSEKLESILKPGRKIVIVTSDMTRPCPNRKLIPPILSRMKEVGIDYSDVAVIIALGLHRRMTHFEIQD
ncbi:lactate racemase domain-containing protein, partial [Mesotoga sp.]|uniref:lactate racemase domain-containing protein n=1 Tax=Mesotoga sp. TaxID=2053577 RepID=UPI00345E4189